MNLSRLVALVVCLAFTQNPSLAESSVNNVYLQLHPAYPEVEGELVDSLLKPPIAVAIPKKNVFQRHPVITKTSASTFTIHLVIWALNHMYVPLDNGRK